MSRKGHFQLVLTLLLAAPLLLAQHLYIGRYEFAAWAWNHAVNSNFHAVVPGKLYRSAQMSHQALEAELREHGIKTVVDLRVSGARPDETGRTEVDVANEFGADYVSVPLATTRLPTKGRLLELIDSFSTAKEPVLVHCSSGQVRTGTATSVWLLSKSPSDQRLVREQLSLIYGYLDVESLWKRWSNGHEPLPTLIDLFLNRTCPELGLRDWVVKGRDEIDHVGKPVFVPPC